VTASLDEDGDSDYTASKPASKKANRPTRSSRYVINKKSIIFDTSDAPNKQADGTRTWSGLPLELTISAIFELCKKSAFLHHSANITTLQYYLFSNARQESSLFGYLPGQSIGPTNVVLQQLCQNIET